jgi:DNA-binding CsgD family transcriptional regulator
MVIPETIVILFWIRNDRPMINLTILLVFAASFIFDIVFDLQEGIAVSHIWHEVGLFFLALLAIAWQVYVILKKNKFIRSLNLELLDTKKSYQDWKEKSHRNAHEIRLMIDQQFALWHLSQSEKDVALLLIKGLAMKEIADIRQTHEKTVRQQAMSIYRKSQLCGRQELAAFFLEDILTPGTPIQANA